jgi:hypothetical protein
MDGAERFRLTALPGITIIAVSKTTEIRSEELE